MDIDILYRPSYSLGKIALEGGEGLVVDRTGPGRVLLQSRSTDQFLAWLIPQLPFERRGQGD